MINRFTGEYAFLSNFYPSGFEAGRFWYPTNEHFYQAMKSTSMEFRVLVSACATAGQAKRMGSKAGMKKAGFKFNEARWDNIKDDVMLHGLRLKFAIPELRDMLIATGDRRLVEGNHWHDNYWGVCRCTDCTLKEEQVNMLGKLLMQVREEVK